MRKRNAVRSSRPPAPRITELAFDPAHIDRPNYPVTLRLSRPLTRPEAQSLSQRHPGLAVADGAVVVPDGHVDELAHHIHDWNRELERAQAAAAQEAGEHDLRRREVEARRNLHANSSELSQHLH